jgi:hypothetical protein
MNNYKSFKEKIIEQIEKKVSIAESNLPSTICQQPTTNLNQERYGPLSVFEQMNTCFCKML